MALTPELKKLKEQLEEQSYASRTLAQDRLLEELKAIDTVTLRKTLDEAAFASVTRMTSPGGACSCCGK